RLFHSSCDALSHNQDTAGLLVKIVEEVIAPGLQWPQPDNSFAVSGHDFLHAQAHALELHRRRIEIFNVQLDWPFGRSLDFRRLETMVLHADGHTCRLLRTYRNAGGR